MQHIMIKVKYTKNFDYFVITLIPYIDLFIKDTNEQLCIYASDMICDILILMYKNNITFRKMTSGFNQLTSDVIELDDLLKQKYDLSIKIKYPKPLNITNSKYLKNINSICVFPKFKPSEKLHNMTYSMIDDITEQIDRTKYTINVVGVPTDKMTIDIGNDIVTFMESLACISSCKLFITSESNWHYIAILCNCRNIIIYNSNATDVNDVIFNPYNATIKITNNLSSTEILTHIKQICN